MYETSISHFCSKLDSGALVSINRHIVWRGFGFFRSQVLNRSFNRCFDHFHKTQYIFYHFLSKFVIFRHFFESSGACGTLAHRNLLFICPSIPDLVIFEQICHFYWFFPLTLISNCWVYYNSLIVQYCFDNIILQCYNIIIL